MLPCPRRLDWTLLSDFDKRRAAGRPSEAVSAGHLLFRPASRDAASDRAAPMRGHALAETTTHPITASPAAKRIEPHEAGMDITRRDFLLIATGAFATV